MIDVAQEHPQAVDVVDRVDQNGAAAGFAAPCEVMIALRLVRKPDRGCRDRAADAALGDQFDCAAHDGVVAAVMAGQRRDRGGLGGLDQFQRIGDGIGHRLLDEDRDTRRNTSKPHFDMQLIGHRDDHTVGAGFAQEIIQRGKAGIAKPGCLGGGLGRGVGDAGEFVVGAARAQDVDVLAPDQSGAGDGNSHFSHGSHGNRSGTFGRAARVRPWRPSGGRPSHRWRGDSR